MLVLKFHPSDESLKVFLMNPRKAWFNPIWVFQCKFYKSRESKFGGFSCLEC